MCNFLRSYLPLNCISDRKFTSLYGFLCILKLKSHSYQLSNEFIDTLNVKYILPSLLKSYHNSAVAKVGSGMQQNILAALLNFKKKSNSSVPPSGYASIFPAPRFAFENFAKFIDEATISVVMLKMIIKLRVLRYLAFHTKAKGRAFVSKIDLLKHP